MSATQAIETETTLDGADIGVVVTYFVGVIAVGLFVSFEFRNICNTNQQVDGLKN